MNETHLSDPVMFSRLVVFSIIPFFLIVGLIGNMFVVYIYARQSQKSNVETFILVLAVIDLIGCILGMPLEMTELYPAIQLNYLCKLYRFIVFICSFMSSLIVISIAIERFRKICCPHDKQITPKRRNTLIIFKTIISVALIIPLVFYTEGVPFTHENKIYMTCDTNFRGTFVWLFSVGVLFLHIILFFTMTVLSLFVQKSITQHLKKKQSEEEACKQEQINHIYIVLISISILYFVSFLPTRVFFVIYPYCKDSNLLQIFKVISYRSWILNSSLNPVMYGFCKKTFRKSIVNIFTRD
ncbi:neuropeptide FF receptor 2-like [Octopus bimaculoides]|uniref:neuropeptide FF receptor 2-like n=1 Tax=Octopus bimaculoides TaxID=37653 RepID=UPI0022E95379|nr:neuropeptide FF receptor 2-like [Octopus bimaculoides]